MSGSSALTTLPRSVGDAPVAAVVLRDLAAAVVAAGTAGHLTAAAVRVDDDGHVTLDPAAPGGSDLDRAVLAAPELSAGGDPTDRSDVYAAACLALTRYLGSSPVPPVVAGSRATTSTRLAAQRQAHRTTPARLGAMPAPFRAVFASATAKAPHLRPTPAQLLALLDAAFAAAGPDVESAARTRLHRLVVLARVFEPTAPLAAAVVADHAAHAPLHLPLRALPAFGPSRRWSRAALIAAVTVVATGGVATAAVVGLRGDGRAPTPEAIVTPAVPSPSSSASPADEDPAAVVSSAAPPAAGAPAAVATTPGGAGSGGQGSGSGTRGNGSNGGSKHGGGSGSHGGGSGSQGGGSGSQGGSGGGASDPGTPGSSDPGTTDPGPSDPGPSDPGPSDPGTTDPGPSDPGPSDPGPSDPGPSDPGTTDPGPSDPGTNDPSSGDQTVASSPTSDPTSDAPATPPAPAPSGAESPAA